MCETVLTIIASSNVFLGLACLELGDYVTSEQVTGCMPWNIHCLTWMSTGVSEGHRQQPNPITWMAGALNSACLLFKSHRQTGPFELLRTNRELGQVYKFIAKVIRPCVRIALTAWPLSIDSDPGPMPQSVPTRYKSLYNSVEREERPPSWSTRSPFSSLIPNITDCYQLYPHPMPRTLPRLPRSIPKKRSTTAYQSLKRLLASWSKTRSNT